MKDYLVWLDTDGVEDAHPVLGDTPEDAAITWAYITDGDTGQYKLVRPQSTAVNVMDEDTGKIMVCDVRGVWQPFYSAKRRK